MTRPAPADCRFVRAAGPPRAARRLLGLAVSALLLAGPAPAQLTAEAPPRGAEQADFVQRLNTQIPLDLQFRDSNGLSVRLGDLFGGKPVILLPVYYECPSMCTLALNGTLDALKQLPFTAGQDFTLITFSFNHKETHVLAEQKKTPYLAEYGRPGAEAGWHFLVGDEANIRALTEAIGFSFQYVDAIGEYAHRSGLVLATREGVISRYFPGVEYEPRDLRFGLIEAAEGRIGSAVDKLFLLCYHYDPTVGAYGLAIHRIVNFSCTVTALVLGAALFAFLRRERAARAVPVRA